MITTMETVVTKFGQETSNPLLGWERISQKNFQMLSDLVKGSALIMFAWNFLPENINKTHKLPPWPEQAILTHGLANGATTKDFRTLKTTRPETEQFTRPRIGKQTRVECTAEFPRKSALPTKRTRVWSIKNERRKSQRPFRACLFVSTHPHTVGKFFHGIVKK